MRRCVGWQMVQGEPQVTRLQAARMEADDARASVARKLRELRELVNEAERSVLTDQPPKVLRIAIKTESVEEAIEIWEACREAVRNASVQPAEMRTAV